VAANFGEEQFGIAEFVQRCKDRVLKFARIISEQSIRLGQWMDWSDSYFTMSDENNFTIWRMIKTCHERGWLYRGHDVMPVGLCREHKAVVSLRLGEAAGAVVLKREIVILLGLGRCHRASLPQRRS